MDEQRDPSSQDGESTSCLRADSQTDATLRARIAALEGELSERSRQLGEARREADEARRELDSFSSAVAHDLRAPLRALDGFSTRLLTLHEPDLSAEGRRYLGRIRRNAQQMGQLVDGLLAWSRVSRLAVHFRDVDPRAVVEKVLDDLQPQLAGRRVDVRIGALVPCRADVRLLETVFAQLLANALKFTRDRETAVIEIGSLPTQRDTDSVGYAVTDNGVGFDMQYADKLFGLFQRLHGPSEYDGTGVGLAICQRIVERHGGRIWARAVPGRGATFAFTLPSSAQPPSARPPRDADAE